jgi:hypothetical protein
VHPAASPVIRTPASPRRAGRDAPGLHQQGREIHAPISQAHRRHRGRPGVARAPTRSAGAQQATAALTGRVCQRRRKPRNSSSARCGRSGLPALGNGTRRRAPGAGHCARLQRRPNGWHDPGEPGRPEPGKPGGTGGQSNNQSGQSTQGTQSGQNNSGNQGSRLASAILATRAPDWPAQFWQPGNSVTPETRATPVEVTPAVRVVTRIAGPLPLTEPKVAERSWVWGSWVRPEIRLPRGRMPALDERDRSVRATAQWLKGL